MALLVPVLFVVSLLTFLLLNLLPGDPAMSLLGIGATPAALATLHHQMHLDVPIWDRYVRWVWAALHGDLGRSYLTGVSAASSIAYHMPITLEMLLLSQVMALAIAVPLGVWSAFRPNGWIDQAATGIAFVGLAVPSFVFGVLLVYVFAVHWRVFPATGYTHLTDNPLANLRSLVLPSLTLALGSFSVYLRVLRADMIATLQEDYITMARAKGMSGRRILWRHAFRPSTFSLATVVGLNVGALVGGAFIVESIFAVPGIGLLTLDSIFQRDYLVVQACVLIVAVGYVFVNFLVDLLYPLLDPRTRHARAAV